jgi:hypothetical protein
MMKYPGYTANLKMFIKLSGRMLQANNTWGSYHRFVRNIARHTILASRHLNDGTIPERVYKKIQWYMVEMVFTGELLATLTGYSINRKDKESLIFLGAIMALFDVVTDDMRLEKSTVNRLLKNTFSSERSTAGVTETSIEKIYYLYLDRLNEMAGKGYWIEVEEYIRIIRFQVNSARQMEENITEEDVISITMAKGGASVLMCSAVMFQISDPLKKALYQLGGFIQMMNDCQDIYKDTVEGIKTFVHFRKSFRAIFDRLDEQREIACLALQSVPCSSRGRLESVFSINAMFVVITYKLRRYAESCNYILDFNLISGMNRSDFRVSLYSPAAIFTCFSKIIRFEYNCRRQIPTFDFGPD